MTVWSDELDALLIRLWEQGLTGEQIAVRIGGVNGDTARARARLLHLPRRAAPGWTAQEDERLKELNKEGLSASVIARRLGTGRSRNAVIGRIHRLRLNPERPPSQPRNHAPSRPKPRPHQRPPQVLRRQQPEPTDPYIEIPEPPRPPGERKRLLDLGEADCRWPIGDPQDADFHFCGRHQHEGLPYCEFHARRAYRPDTEQPREVREHRRQVA